MTFKEYYKYYLTLHRNKWCRLLHALGQLATICFVATVVFYKLWFALILTPFIVYPFAWSGHYFFEKNKPAAFSNPLWAKACDWIMLKDMITGRINDLMESSPKLSENEYHKVSEIYDLLHHDKNYSDEADFMKACVDKFSDFSKINNILDFGCGTCSHLPYLIYNKKATGLDISPEMIAVAKKKNLKNLKLFVGKLSNFQPEEKYDLCISMFHVINHIKSPSELRDTFLHISDMLEPKSLFIFDCLNAVAVFRDEPKDRVLNKQIENKEYQFASKCFNQLMLSSFTMNNQIQFEGKTYNQSLAQKLWTPGFLIDLLNESGFEVLEVFKNFTFESAGVDDYKICFIARKK